MLATVCHKHQILVPVGERCGACTRESAARGHRRRSANNARLGRNSSHWRRISKRRVREAGGCEIGLPGCTGEAATCDLIGGGDHAHARIEDTRAACRSCHGQVDGGRR